MQHQQRRPLLRVLGVEPQQRHAIGVIASFRPFKKPQVHLLAPQLRGEELPIDARAQLRRSHGILGMGIFQKLLQQRPHVPLARHGLCHGVGVIHHMVHLIVQIHLDHGVAHMVQQRLILHLGHLGAVQRLLTPQGLGQGRGDVVVFGGMPVGVTDSQLGKLAPHPLEALVQLRGEGAALAV